MVGGRDEQVHLLGGVALVAGVDGDRDVLLPDSVDVGLAHPEFVRVPAFQYLLELEDVRLGDPVQAVDDLLVPAGHQESDAGLPLAPVPDEEVTTLHVLAQHGLLDGTPRQQRDRRRCGEPQDASAGRRSHARTCRRSRLRLFLGGLVPPAGRQLPAGGFGRSCQSIFRCLTYSYWFGPRRR